MDFTLGGEHLFGPLSMDWSLNYAQASEYRPNERYIDYQLKKQKFDLDLSDERWPIATPQEGSTFTLSDQFSLKELTEQQEDIMERDLKALLEGKKVEIPEYNFTTGKREYNGKRLQLGEGKILLIEGIHALNPMLTAQIPDQYKYKIYTSTLTAISLDDHNWIPTRDNRLLRRIIRDYNKGAFTARETISQWPAVCEGEEKWIYPYQENADVMFNSALNIEFAVLRNHAEPILASVPRNCPEYAEAHRLLKFIHYFTPIQDKEIPPTSIMREFVGGSSFKY